MFSFSILKNKHFLYFCRPKVVLFLSIFLSSLFLVSWHYDFEKTSGAPFNIRAFVFNMYFNRDISLDYFWESAGVDIAYSPNGSKYSGYPPGAAFLTFPFFVIQQIIVFLVIKIFGYLNGNIAWMIESLFIALPSIIAASLSSALLFDLLRDFKIGERVSFLISWTFFFTTFLPAYTSVIHYNNLSMFFGFLSLWLLLKLGGLNYRKTSLSEYSAKAGRLSAFLLRKQALGWVFTGIFLGVAGITEYVTALFFIPVFMYAVISGQDRKNLFGLLVGYLLPISVLLFYNTVSFGAPWMFSHMFVGKEVKKGLIFGSGLHRGLFGLYLSPLRGLVFYAPLVLFSIRGFYRMLKTFRNEALLLLGFIIIPSIVYGFWREWWGGWNYGPRFLLSTLPSWFILAGFGLVKTNKRPGLYRDIVMGFLVVFGYFSGFVASLNGIRSKVQMPPNTFHFTFVEKLKNLLNGMIEGNTDRFTSMFIRLREDTPIIANIDAGVLIYIYLLLVFIISIYPLFYLTKIGCGNDENC